MNHPALMDELLLKPILCMRLKNSDSGNPGFSLILVGATARQEVLEVRTGEHREEIKTDAPHVYTRYLLKYFIIME